ncbi:MAG: cysteine desulfurase [Verrucomicrobia bacterium]|nr:cysteine desulfurase [Verrucomicrobiota bacterium]MBI3868793.1 cysteine desulfurase [Verrucomicrobiota bacterium]
MRTIYFDYNATTPLDPDVREVMEPFWADCFGNPSSIHHVGRRARALLDDARDRAARVFRCRPSEIVFTSGGTESVNLAVLGTARMLRERGRHIVTSSVEHHAVLHALDYLERREGFQVERLPVDARGCVSVDRVVSAIRSDTILVSLQAANNEMGALQPLRELSRICREKGVLLHTDAVQWFGKMPWEGVETLGADLISLCGHKFHGPKGSGLLYIRSPLHPDPLLFGGGHENERRAGTENLPGIMGLAAAMERFIRPPVFDPVVLCPLASELREALSSLDALGVRVLGDKEVSLSNTVAFVVPRSDSMTLLANFDLEGVCGSAGSACSAGSLEPSHVASAMGFSAAEGRALVRFSLGRGNTSEEVAHVRGILPRVIALSQTSG